MSFRRRALFLAGLFVAVSCSDAGNPLEPGGPPKPGPEPDGILQALDCSVSIQSGAMSCAPAQPSTGQALGAGELIIGNQGTYVTLAASNFSTAADTVAFDVTVKNQIVQPLGTENGTTLDSAGVRVFFFEEPTGNPSGTADVANEDGQKIFLNGATDPFYQYNEVLSNDEVSPPKRWKLTYAGGATSIRFKVYVAAKVQYENGWVDVTPEADTVAPGDSIPLVGKVFNRAGRRTSEVIEWTSLDTAIAFVSAIVPNSADTSATAYVKGKKSGTVQIVGSTGTRSPDTVTVVVNTLPSFVRDSIGAVSNVTVSQAAPGLLEGAGDTDTGHSVSVVPDTVTTEKGGIAWVNADGSWEYLNKAGFSGRDTIRFEITDGVSRSQAYAIADVQASNYWYVQPGGTGDGRDRFPFGTLGAAQDSAGAGDTILVLANGVQQVDGAVTLEAGQAIIGQGIPASITRDSINGQTITILATGSAPALTNTAAGATVTLGSNNTIRGVGITAAEGAAIAGSGFGTLFVRNVAVNPDGPAVELSTGAVDAIFDVLSSTGSGTTGLSLTNVTGTLTGTAGAISGATGTAFHVSGGSADISYAGSITSASGAVTSISGRTGGTLTLSGTLTATGSGISVTGNSGGTIAFTGASKSISTANNAGVTLTGNDGATVSFNGGELDVTTTSGAAFAASGGGTVSVTGAGNSLTSTTGTALSLDGVSTGASGVSFASVSADGAANGILLSGVAGAGVQVNGGTIQNTTSHGVQLVSLGTVPVELAGLSVTGTLGGGNAGIFAAASDNVEVAGVTVNVSGGPALSLSDVSLAHTSGAGAATFSTLSSSGSTSNGVILTDVGGSFTADAGTIGTAASTAFAVAGGTVTATFAGNISQGNNAPLLAVSGNHNGSLTFNTGTLSATNGTGLQFNDAQGTYAFTGTTTLNGGDAGIDITNSSDGTFTFGAGTSVTSPTGSAFVVYGASPTVVYNGSLTKGNAGLLVEIGEQPGGSVTFQNGTLSATAGTGISLSNADGAVSFNGTTTLNGGDAGVDVVSGSQGAIAFGASTRITAPSGIALRVANGGAETNVTFAGKIASSATGLAAHVEGVSGGTVTVSDSIGGSQGILVQNNTGGTISFTGAIKTFSTGASQAVALSSNASASVVFGGGGLAITTTSGTGFGASGGGTVEVTGAGNTISSSTGTALSLASVSTGSSGVNLASVSANGAANGVVLSNLTGVGLQVNGGTIQGTTGAAVSLSSLASLSTGVQLSGMTLSRTAGTGTVITGSNFGTLSVSSTAVSASGGPTALSLNTGTLSGTFSSINASGAAAATNAVQLTSVGGTYTVSAGTVSTTSSGGDALKVSGGNATATWTATLNGTGNGQAVDIENTSGGSYSFATVNPGNTSGGVRISANGGAVSFSTLTLGTSGARYTAAPISLAMGAGNVSLGAVSIFTSGANALATTSAAGSGTLSVSSGTIDATTGTAVHIAPSSGTQRVAISLTRVNASGGANGILLSNIGTSGSFAVTGNTSGNCGGDANPSPGAAAPYGARTVPVSSDCSGGTIQGTVGADGGTGGTGVYLSNAGNVSLTRVRLTGTHQNFGIRGSTVSALTLDNVLLDGTFGDNIAVDEGGVSLDNLTGSATVSSSSFSGAVEHDFQVRNLGGGTLNRVTFDNVTFGIQTAANASDHLLLTSDGGGTLNATIQNSRFMGARGDMFQFVVQNNSTSDLVVQNNVFFNQHGSIVSGGGGTGVGVGSSASDASSLTYLVTANRFRGARGTAFGVQKGSGTGAATGSVTNNIVGDASVANSGSNEGNGLAFILARQGKSKALIDNNQVFQYNGNSGIFFLTGGAVASGGSNNGAMHATVRRNTVSNPGSNNPGAVIDGMRFEAGSNSGDVYTMCLDVGQGSGNANNIGSGGRAAEGGVAFSFMANTPSATPVYKLRGYPSVTHSGTAAHSTVQSTVSSANGGAAGYQEMPNSTTTHHANAGTGAACDLF